MITRWEVDPPWFLAIQPAQPAPVEQRSLVQPRSLLLSHRQVADQLKLLAVVKVPSSPPNSRQLELAEEEDDLCRQPERQHHADNAHPVATAGDLEYPATSPWGF